MRKKHLEREETLELRHSELMDIFAKHSPDPIFRFNIKSKLIFANDVAARMYPGKQLLKTKVDSLFPKLKNHFANEIIERSETFEFTLQIDNRYYQMIVVGLPKAKVGHIHGRDITELLNALEKAQQADKLKDNFLAQISHEIRTPLNSIQGFASMLVEKGFSEEYSHIFRSIENNSKRIWRTVHLILDYASIRTGSYILSKHEIIIVPVIKKLHSEFKSVAIEKNLELKFNCNISLETKINSDDGAIEQICWNLIDNAIKFTHKGKIEISLDSSPTDVIITIEDTGIGISDEYKKKLFTPFSQEFSGYSRPFEGAGLGLALVKSLVSLISANIEMDSRSGKGTKFKVSIPINM
ncbi:MAG: HAMP domain-containing histidine kinase [Melioribacteraceae bacterium]|nr:HAMP domain-containing histidine kinase [Melioribacteraceae bacterium]MCF8354721.1 HAMP domain-containing histidine kinase [Melioribacteraceae bacterium]MCF8394350.1 HAMP domain-containing histidine kinase [Melioribacteraceae bacterium]MCF8420060.1 HAMP domain-containing histidine kinase [Melioribacteraceae bacterium]